MRITRLAALNLAVVAVAVALAARVAPPPASAADEPKPTSAAPASLGDDLQLVQGTWERELHPEERDKVNYRRVVKQIEGNAETVTYYDEAGKVTRAHTVEFKLERHGPVRVFTFWNQEVTAGPDKGKRYPDARSYVYRVTNDTFDEVWGFLAGQERRPISYHVHRRPTKGGDAVTAGAAERGTTPATPRANEPAAPAKD